MNHDVDHETLTRHLDDELPPAESRRVEEHLSRCTECRREAEMMRRMKTDLAELPGGEPGRDGSVWDAVDRRLTRPLGWFLLVVGAAAGLALGAWGFVTADAPLAEKLATGAVAAGLLLLLVSVARERWKEWRNDPYRRVER